MFVFRNQIIKKQIINKHSYLYPQQRLFSKFNPNEVRVISFDITGTILTHKEPVAKTYADAALWAKLDHPPNQEEMQMAFKKAYKEICLLYPCFGGQHGLSDRQWLGFYYVYVWYIYIVCIDYF